MAMAIAEHCSIMTCDHISEACKAAFCKCGHTFHLEGENVRSVDNDMSCIGLSREMFLW